DVMQEITVIAAEDDDALDESGVIPVSAEGKGYESVEEDVSVSIIDNDEAALVLLEAPMEIREGGSGRFRMNLATRPIGDVKIVFTQENTALVSSPGQPWPAADEGFSGSLPESTGLPSLIFTPDDWNKPQEVIFVAREDEDAVDEQSRLYLSAMGGGYDGVGEQIPIAIKDDDRRGLIFDGAPMELAEGEVGYFRVRLATRPISAVTLMVEVPSGADLEVDADAAKQGRQSAVVIEPADWNEMREMQIEAMPDEDDNNEYEEIRFQVSGGDYEGVMDRMSVTVRDAGKSSAWLTRFSRTVGLQAIEGIESRMDSGRRRDSGVSA
ncbi:MAG: hypothetical protein ISN28_07410, partial [Ectothiorhodospiraceae bacterium AqS1]|nr:hypothetical protein [Ectothiorhodospiraceae bacterium AqS1]